MIIVWIIIVVVAILVMLKATGLGISEEDRATYIKGLKQKKPKEVRK